MRDGVVQSDERTVKFKEVAASKTSVEKHHEALTSKEIIEYLKLGFRVTIYPEATSHNGEEILPFKRTLLTSAAHAGVPILPYVFNFVSLNGEPFSKKNRDSVCWYGDISFARSLLNLLALKTLVCEVEFLDPVYSKPDDDRAKVADYVREKIVEKFRPAR